MEKLPSKNLNSSHQFDKSVDNENVIITNEDDILLDSSEPLLKMPRTRVGKIHRWDTEKDLSNGMVDDFRAGGSGDQRARNRKSRISGGSRNEESLVRQRLRAIGGSTVDLEPIEIPLDIKFSVRNRLYVGNLSKEMAKLDGLRELFEPYGELSEVFINAEKNFAFLRVDNHLNALKAQRALDGTFVNGRQLRIRLASSESIVRVKNLTDYVSNELLYQAFEVFGAVERAIVTVDDRGNSKGEGIVEFTKKSSALACLRLCADNCFFLTASMRPCIVEPLELKDETIGMPEKALNKNSPQFINERQSGPRFAAPDSVEHEYGSKWKQLHYQFESKHAALINEFKREEQKLEMQLEFWRSEHETEMLRQELRMREAHHERRKMQLELLQNPRQNLGYENTPPQFGYADTESPSRQPFGYHKNVQMQCRPSDGMRRQQELEAEFIPQQIFTMGENRPMQNVSPFVVFQGDDSHSKTSHGSLNNVFIRDERPNESKSINIDRNPNQENNSLWGRRTL